MPRNIICVICAALTIGCAAEFNPNLGGLSGTETGDSTTDVGTADTETSTGSTDETGSTGDGDGDGDTGTETGDPDPLQPGDLCHPLVADGQECPQATSCSFQGWDEEGEYWAWTCELSEGDGQFTDECPSIYWASNSCATGLACQPASLFAPNDCTSQYCCSEFCDVLNPTCSNGYDCVAWGDETSMFPPFFQDTDVPYVGVCTAP